MRTRGLRIALCSVIGAAGVLGCGGSEEELPSAAGSVVINEVTSEGNDAIELYNKSATPADVSGWIVQDSAKSAADRYVLPGGTVIQPGGFLVLRKDQQHAFGLSKDDAVFLSDSTGQTMDIADWGSDEAAISYCRIPDGTGDFKPCFTATFGSANSGGGGSTEGIVAPTWTGIGPGGDFFKPDEVGYDAQGRLWIGDPEKLRIVVFDASGNFLRQVGGEGSGMGEFSNTSSANGPHAIRRSTDGASMYVADRGGQRIIIYDTQTFEATGTITYTSFGDPKAIAVRSDGTIYVADQSSEEVYRFSKAGALMETWPTASGTITNKDGQPCGIPCNSETLAIDESHDRMFLTSSDAGRIEVYTLSTGVHSGLWVVDRQKGATPEPGRVKDEVEGIAVSEKRGLLFAMDEHNARILVLDLNSPDLTNPDADFAAIGAFGKHGSGAGEMAGSDGLDIDATGNLLALGDQENDRVQVFSIDAIESAIGK